MALNWSFWNGLQYPGYCDFACEFRQKFHMNERISIGILLGIFILCCILIWWKRKGFK